MAKIPTHVQQVTPSGSVAGAFIPSDIADIGQGIEAQGLASLARGGQDLTNAVAQIAFAAGSSEADTAATTASSRIKLLDAELSTVNDPNKYDALFDAAFAEIEALRPESSIGGKQFDDFLEKMGEQWQTGVDILKIQQFQSNIEGDYILNLAEARTSGNLELANLLTLNARDNTGAITPEQAARDLATSAALIQKIAEEKDIDAIVSNALTFTIQEGVAQGLPDTDAGLKAIRDSGLSPSNRVKANTTYNALVKQQRDALEVQREADRDKLNNLLATDKLTPGEINATSLSEIEQLSYDKLYRSWAKDGPKIITDEQVRADLRRSVINIGRGANTKTQVMALLNEARFGDGPTIDDAAYKELSALAETTLNKVQGDFLAEAHRDGQEQLVDFTKEEFIVLAAEGRLTESQLQRRKAQLWWADRFDNEMELWIQNNPDKNKREGYQQEQMVLASYINTSHADIEVLRARTLTSLQAQDARRREGKAVPLTEAELQGGMTDLIAAEKRRTIKEGEAIAAEFLAKHPLESIDATVKPFKAKPKVTMQGPSGGTAQIHLRGISVKLDQGFKFPVGSNVKVKRNPTDSDVEFEGLTIKPNGRVISLDGGETWQLLP